MDQHQSHLRNKKLGKYCLPKQNVLLKGRNIHQKGTYVISQKGGMGGHSPPTKCDDSIKILGRGATGVVCLKRDQSGPFYVVKQMVKEFEPDGTPSIVQAEGILNETTILDILKKKCQDYILCFNSFSQDKEYYYIITEYLEHYIDLSDFINQSHGNLGQNQLIDLCEKIKHGLETIHQLEVAHRDIKPNNIMINETNHSIKYIDFGESCLKKRCINQGFRPGTTYYMAPELLSSSKNDIPPDFNGWKLADYWSLGITLLEIMMGGQFFYEYLISAMTKKSLKEVQQMKTYMIGETINQIMKSGFPKSMIKQYCHDFLPSSPTIHKYFEENVFSLLHNNPKNRHLVYVNTSNKSKIWSSFVRK
jgi:serine/threonine protein kinase